MTMTKEEKFNKWFNAFILVGMAVAVVLATLLKIGDSASANALLIISAAGALMGVLATVCSANGMILTFLFGLLDVSVYGVMCLLNWRDGNSGLGNAILHFVYFVPMQFVGFLQWKKRGADGRTKVKARRMSLRDWGLVSAMFAVGSVVGYIVIARFDRSAAEGFIRTAVVLDVLPLMCNIIGQLLMSTAYMEQWIFWIGVNVTSIMMWSFSLKDAPDSFALIYIVKYSFYLINSVNGLRIWIRLSRKS